LTENAINLAEIRAEIAELKLNHCIEVEILEAERETNKRLFRIVLALITALLLTVSCFLICIAQHPLQANRPQAPSAPSTQSRPVERAVFF
jgi:lipopolysaccharide/colanic/teichoic acid biosynthesis glycosyltransferase